MKHLNGLGRIFDSLNFQETLRCTFFLIDVLNLNMPELILFTAIETMCTARVDTLMSLSGSRRTAVMREDP